MMHSKFFSRNSGRMSWVVVSALGVAVLFWQAARSLQGQPAPTPNGKVQASNPQDLQADLAEAARLVEAGQFQAFLEGYAPVEVLRVLRHQGRVERAAASMSKQPQLQLLFVLKSLKQLTPRYDSTRGLATFEFDPFHADAVTAAPDLRLPDTSQLELKGLGSDLAAAVSEAIRLLEDGDVSTFAERMLPPTELARLSRPDQMEALRQQFRDTPELSRAIVADLKRILTIKGTPGENDKFATFTIAAQGTTPARSIKFQKFGNDWRFYDDGPRVAAEISRQSGLKPRGNVMPVHMERVGGNWRFIEIPLFQIDSLLE